MTLNQSPAFSFISWYAKVKEEAAATPAPEVPPETPAPTEVSRVCLCGFIGEHLATGTKIDKLNYCNTGAHTHS